MKRGLILAAIVFVSLGLTPQESKIIQHALDQTEIAIQHGKTLEAEVEKLKGEAEQASASASSANSSAGSAWASAFTTGIKAAAAAKEAEACQKENAEMRPIVKAVTGPWWFPGLNALLYGIKKCSISLVVIIVGIVVILVVIKLLTGLSCGAIFTPILGFFAKIPGWIMALIRRLKPKPKPKQPPP